MKGTGAKRHVCPGSCVSTGAKFPVAPVESAPMQTTLNRCCNLIKVVQKIGKVVTSAAAGNWYVRTQGPWRSWKGLYCAKNESAASLSP